MTDFYYEPPEPCCDNDDCDGFQCVADAAADWEDEQLARAENRADIERFGP